MTEKKLDYKHSSLFVRSVCDKEKSFGDIIISGLYYKHVTIVNYASSSINKLRASLNDDARVIIYDRHMFIVQATGVNVIKNFFLCY
jgi:hypothetical protein